jgi:hypothetical protein
MFFKILSQTILNLITSFSFSIISQLGYERGITSSNNDNYPLIEIEHELIINNLLGSDCEEYNALVLINQLRTLRNKMKKFQEMNHLIRNEKIKKLQRSETKKITKQNIKYQ